MAIFDEKKDTGDNSYVALLDTAGDLVAFIQPVKGVSKELIAEALQEKGLACEVRESREARTELIL